MVTFAGHRTIHGRRSHSHPTTNPPQTSISLATRPVQGVFFLLGGGVAMAAATPPPAEQSSSHATKKKENNRMHTKLAGLAAVALSPVFTVGAALARRWAAGRFGTGR